MAVNVRDMPSTRVQMLGRDSGYWPVAVTTDGRHVLIVHRAGAGHVGRGGRLEAFISEDSAESWSDPVVVLDSDWDDREIAIGATPSGILVAGIATDRAYANNDGAPHEDRLDNEARLTRSLDGGYTWEDPRPINIDDYMGFIPFGQCIALEDGSMLMPLYGGFDWKDHKKSPAMSAVLRSTDQGLTWEPWTVIAEGMNETTLLPRKGERLMAVMRSDQDKHLYQSIAHMKTLEWTEPVKIVDHHPGCLVRLSSGHILLAYGVRTGPSGARGIISTDEGESWLSDRQIIFGDDATNWDCGYPTVVTLTGGRLLVAYYTTAQEDILRCDGALCHVVVCDEREVLDAIGL